MNHFYAFAAAETPSTLNEGKSAMLTDKTRFSNFRTIIKKELTGLGFWDTHILASTPPTKNTPISDSDMEFGPYCGNKAFSEKWDEKTSKYTEGHIKVWERHDSSIIAYLRTRIHSTLSTSFTEDMTAKELWDTLTSVCKL
jgi:hypothetical protein